MRKLIWGSLAATVLLSPTLAMAEGDTYAGAHVTQYTLDTADSQDLKPKAITVVFGGNVSENVAIEARVGRGVQDDDSTEAGSFLVTQTVGLYSKVGMDVATPVGTVHPYGIIGMSKYNIEASGGDTSTDSSLSAGVGVIYSPMAKLDTSVEYMRVAHENRANLNGLSLGATWHFGE